MAQLFDDIFRTLCEKNPHLLIPLINEAFHKNYPMTEKIELLSGEHHILSEHGKSLAERITDSAIRIGNKIYHLECQSNPDGSMVLRMVEYDFHIALENIERTDKGYRIRFPESAVLYLRHGKSTPDEIQMEVVFPQNEPVTYRVPIIKTQQYTEDDIIGKQLYFLIPYAIMKYEHAEDEFLDKISTEYKALYQGMIEARDAELLSEYDMSNIIDFTNRLANNLFEKNQDVKREVNTIMGGEILETYADRMIAKGRLEGELEGERRGRLEGERRGKLEGKVAILHELDFTIDQIAERLSLSVEQVKEILNQVK